MGPDHDGVRLQGGGVAEGFCFDGGLPGGGFEFKCGFIGGGEVEGWESFEVLEVEGDGLHVGGSHAGGAVAEFAGGGWRYSHWRLTGLTLV